MKTDPECYEILLNFDIQSTENEELKAWLNVPVKDIKTVTNKILSNILDIDSDEEE